MAARRSVLRAEHRHLLFRPGRLSQRARFPQEGNTATVVERLRGGERPAAAAVALVPHPANHRGAIGESLPRVEVVGDVILRRRVEQFYERIVVVVGVRVT